MLRERKKLLQKIQLASGVVLLAMACSIADYGQTTNAQQAFEVASVRMYDPASAARYTPPLSAAAALALDAFATAR